MAFQGLEHSLRNCEVLINTGFRWIPFLFTDNFPPNAVVGGQSEDGNQQFIGRADISSAYGTIGRIPSDIKMLHLPFNGEEVVKDFFDILVTHDESNPEINLPAPSASTNRSCKIFLNFYPSIKKFMSNFFSGTHFNLLYLSRRRY